nr:MAG TPA: hypothetical protein [Caudoviricetes sp.]
MNSNIFIKISRVRVGISSFHQFHKNTICCVFIKKRRVY